MSNVNRIPVTQRQAFALTLFADDYDVLNALLTLTHEEITQALACGYVITDEEESE